MKKFLLFDSPLKGETSSILLLLLRLFIGVMMFMHGWGKLTMFAEMSMKFPDPLGVGSTASLVLSLLAEVGCSGLLIFGVFTRLATLPLIFNMLVAIFVIHGGDTFQVKELAVMYLAVYVLLFFLGGGRYSLDNVFLKKIRMI